MDITDQILSFYYGFIYASIISFARLFTDRCRSAFYEKSRKTIIHKWKYILSGRSHCDKCGRNIRSLYLIPVFGYILSLGKCSKCHKKISSVYFIEEAIAFLYGLIYFTIAYGNIHHYHISTIIMALYLFICYFIATIDFHYFIIASEAIIAFFCIALLEVFLVHTSTRFLLAISVPATWFALMHLVNYFMPGKLGMADIHLIPALCFAAGFPHSLYLPTLAAFLAIIYFFIRFRKENWKNARLKKIPFGLFLAIAFLILKLIPVSFMI